MPQFDQHTARFIVQALRLVDVGGDAKEALRTLAANLEIEPIGMEGEWTHYSPAELHLDEFGFGLLPGEECLIRLPGWMYADGTVIMKAVVSLSATQRRQRAEAREPKGEN